MRNNLTESNAWLGFKHVLRIRQCVNVRFSELEGAQSGVRASASPLPAGTIGR